MKNEINGRITEQSGVTNAKGNNSLMTTQKCVVSESGKCFMLGPIVFEYVTEKERLKASRGPIGKMVYQMDGNNPGVYCFRWGRWECLEPDHQKDPKQSLVNLLKSKLITFFA